MSPSVHQLPFFNAETNHYNVIIETPKGSRNKYTYDEKLNLYTLRSVLPAGASFPFDFGFLPATLGEDGDPLDVLLLMDEPAFPGCLVATRLIGVLEVAQTKEGTTLRNDRFLGVPAVSRTYESIQTLQDLDPHLVQEIEHFFKSYVQMKGQELEVINRFGPEKAAALIAAGGKAFGKQETGGE